MRSSISSVRLSRFASLNLSFQCSFATSSNSGDLLETAESQHKVDRHAVQRQMFYNTFKTNRYYTNKRLRYIFGDVYQPNLDTKLIFDSFQWVSSSIRLVGLIRILYFLGRFRTFQRLREKFCSAFIRPYWLFSLPIDGLPECILSWENWQMKVRRFVTRTTSRQFWDLAAYKIFPPALYRSKSLTVWHEIDLIRLGLHLDFFRGIYN